KKVIVWLVSLFFLLLGFVVENHALVLSLVLAYSLLISLLFSRISILDPRSLFVIMLAIYSTWFPLQVVIFGYEGPLTIDSSALLATIRLQMFGIVVFVLVCTAIINERKVAV